MIKNLYDNIVERIRLKKEERIKQKEFEAKMSKEYPRSYVYWGKYDKDVTEDSLQYTYSHNECFLASTGFITEDTKFKRLTGDNAGEVLLVKDMKDYDEVIVIDDGIKYSIPTYSSNNLDESWLSNHNITLREIIRKVNSSNELSRQQVISRIELDNKMEEEFTNN